MIHHPTHGFLPWAADRAQATGVQFTLKHPEAKPEDSHNSWLAEKERTGWKWGPVKDPELKLHPCFVPYDELPPEQKLKDYLFQSVVRSLADSQPIQDECDPMLAFLASIHVARSYLEAQDMDPRNLPRRPEDARRK